MPNITDTARIAGKAMQEFFGLPGIKTAAIKTAVGTGAEQLLPRVIGQQPGRSLAGSLARSGMQAAVSTPIEMGLQRVGLPTPIASLAGDLAAVPIVNAVSKPVTPEPQSSFQAEYNQLAQMQQMQAASEQQRYNNEIQLALAKNYSYPTKIIHENPSADFSTMQNILNPNVRY